jgi:hypothetical protein
MNPSMDPSRARRRSRGSLAPQFSDCFGPASAWGGKGQGSEWVLKGGFWLSTFDWTKAFAPWIIEKAGLIHGVANPSE